MDNHLRHQKVWNFLYPIINLVVKAKFNMQAEAFHADGPCLIISNHVTNWDPLLVAMSLKRKQAYFVASEHIFRLGIISKLFIWMQDPIARRKASSGTDTVKACLRHLKSGHSVILFAEGETTWDGESGKVFPATAKLARSSGASLVTYRLEGGYLSFPRWAKSSRKGRINGHVVRVYSPEELRKMTPEQIDEAINSDIHENAWERQTETGISFRSSRKAEGLETAVCLCPKCRQIATLAGRGNSFSCLCGFELKLNDTMRFEPAEPFADIQQWLSWQDAELRSGSFEHGDFLFADEDIRLIKLGTDHSEQELCCGTLIQYPDRLAIGEYSFKLSALGSLAMVLTNRLLFTCGGEYYELISNNGQCMRKYLIVSRP